MIFGEKPRIYGPPDVWKEGQGAGRDGRWPMRVEAI
jgi:hypothetical protein